MKQTKYRLVLSDIERSLMVKSLIDMRNNLIAEGKYTDLVNEALCKLARAKKKKVKIEA